MVERSSGQRRSQVELRFPVGLEVGLVFHTTRGLSILCGESGKVCGHAVHQVHQPCNGAIGGGSACLDCSDRKRGLAEGKHRLHHLLAHRFVQILQTTTSIFNKG